MNNNLRFGTLLLAACFMMGSMRAQTTSPSASSSATMSGVPGDSDTQQTGTDETDQHKTSTPAEEVQPKNTDTTPVYVPALDGTGLMSQDEALRGRLLVGANYSAGYDTNPNGLENSPKSGVSLISPFIGVQVNSPNLRTIVQYQPTLRHYFSNRYEGGTMHVGSANITGFVNERWKFNALVLGRHGQDSIAMLAPQQTVPVGDVPGTRPASNAFNLNTNTITSLDGIFDLNYLTSERSSLGIKAENAYASYDSLVGNSLLGTVNTTYMHAITPTLQWLAYGTTSRYYGFVHCYAFGGGGGLEWRPEEHTYLHLSGGPQFNSSACGQQQGFSYDAAYSHHLTPRSQIYMTSTREAGSTDLGPGLWNQTAAIGYQHDFDRRESLAFDFGYFNTTGQPKSNGYDGKYVDGIYNRILGHGLRAVFSYRWYTGNTFQSNFTRTTALLSIAWTPTAGHLFQ
jgi:hypothetical protein